MWDLISKAIKRIYCERDYEFLREKSKLDLHFPIAAEIFARECGIVISKTSDSHSPSCRWDLQYKPFSKNEFSVIYSSTLLVNKVVPIFYLQHEFEIENKDEDRMGPVLDGFDVQPYTKTQAQMQDIIINSLIQDGYTQLSFAELNECVHSLKFNEGVTIFGPNVTVEHSLFIDYMGICED